MSDEQNKTKKAELPKGTKKPTLPGTKKPQLPEGAKPATPPQGVKPAGPPKKATKPAKPPAKAAKLPAKSAKLPKGPKLPPMGKRQAGPAVKRPGAPAPAGGDGAPFTRKDFASDADVRWCPGCGDYAVLATVQRTLPELVERKEDVVFISGIGCSSRFPYYMNTYGMHSIHGRAPAVATGLKCANPALDVWIITGDGDALSIGGNHLIHLLRRNLDVQLLLFNNQIYGLTKGQYSPTSEAGKVTKSTPYGSLDHPFNPVALALGADASFVARTMDRDPKHMQALFRRAHAHRGAAFIEVYQNCNIFNDGAFFRYTERESKPHTTVFLEDGQPLVYDEGTKGLRLDGLKLHAVDLTNGQWSADDCLVHDETDRALAGIIGRVFWDETLPQPFGVFYREERPTYERLLREQQEAVVEKRGTGDLHALLRAGDTWTIE